MFLLHFQMSKEQIKRVEMHMGVLYRNASQMMKQLFLAVVSSFAAQCSEMYERRGTYASEKFEKVEHTTYYC